MLDILPSRIRSAVSLCAVGGRLAVLPIDDSAPMNALDAEKPCVMCIRASGAFPAVGSGPGVTGHSPLLSPRSAMRHSAAEGCLPCFVELSVRRNASVETEHQIHSASKAGRQPNGLLRVRCSDSALRSSVLEVLVQQLLTPQQLLDAAAATLEPKTRAGNV